jgi:hypothetical protein
MSNYRARNSLRLPFLDGEDYHEFIVKMEKKAKVNLRKRFQF